MSQRVAATVIYLVSPWLASVFAVALLAVVALGPAGTVVTASGAEDSGNASPNATVLVEHPLADPDPSQSYAGQRYVWLGRHRLEISVTGAIPAGTTLRLSAGAKGDRRGFVVQWLTGTTVVHTESVEYGGYDGFRLLDLPIPEKARNELGIRLLPGGPKAAFFSRLAFVFPPSSANATDSVKVAVTLTPAESTGPVDGGFAAAYPEIARLWLDRGEPPEAVPVGSDEWAFHLAARFARQSHEMFFRCKKYLEGWLAQADPQTGLIPRNLTNSRDFWNAEDAAADNYPFLVLAAFVTDKELFHGRMHQMLQTETRLTSRLGVLPDAWSFSKQAFLRPEPSLPALIFGGSEYVKDGLLPLTEYLGPSPWLDRLIAIEEAVWEHAPVATPFGKIPSENVEINGEQLQVLSRLFWLTGQPKYLDWAKRLGNYYLLGGHHPTRDFDALRLRDHGCEIVSGLCELYVAVSFADKPTADLYRPAIHEMCDRILELGRDPRGMLYNVIYPKQGTHDPSICDTWGYNYNGIYSVYLIDKKSEYREAIRFVLSNLYDQVGDYHWGSADEYADSIEGAINLYNRERVPSAAVWIDRKIRDMWKPQQPSGIIEGWHGDGNVARTALMYAFWKTQGLRVEPWRDDILLGAVYHQDSLYISLTVSKPWSGKLIFDRPRHRHYLHLPIDYPRINQFPEWFTVDDNEILFFCDYPRTNERQIPAQEAWQGVAIDLAQPGTYRWIVTKERQ